MAELICVGAIAGAFGVKGEVRLKSFTTSPEAIADYAPLFTENGDIQYDVVITVKQKMVCQQECLELSQRKRQII